MIWPKYAREARGLALSYPLARSSRWRKPRDWSKIREPVIVSNILSLKKSVALRALIGSFRSSRLLKNWICVLKLHSHFFVPQTHCKCVFDTVKADFQKFRNNKISFRKLRNFLIYNFRKSLRSAVVGGEHRIGSRQFYAPFRNVFVGYRHWRSCKIRWISQVTDLRSW